MEIRDLLQHYGIRPSKGLGQNLLVADWAYERIVAASEITRDDFVLEVGPGLGTLTRRLADVAGHVTAVELEARMVAVLVDTLAGRANVTVREGDILEIPPDSLVQEPAAATCSRYKVVANLPYYITSRVLRHLLTALPLATQLRAPRRPCSRARSEKSAWSDLPWTRPCKRHKVSYRRRRRHFPSLR